MRSCLYSIITIVVLYSLTGSVSRADDAPVASSVSGGAAAGARANDANRVETVVASTNDVVATTPALFPVVASSADAHVTAVVANNVADL